MNAVHGPHLPLPYIVTRVLFFASRVSAGSTRKARGASALPHGPFIVDVIVCIRIYVSSSIEGHCNHGQLGILGIEAGIGEARYLLSALHGSMACLSIAAESQAPPHYSPCNLFSSFTFDWHLIDAWIIVNSIGLEFERAEQCRQMPSDPAAGKRERSEKPRRSRQWQRSCSNTSCKDHLRQSRYWHLFVAGPW